MDEWLTDVTIQIIIQQMIGPQPLLLWPECNFQCDWVNPLDFRGPKCTCVLSLEGCALMMMLMMIAKKSRPQVAIASLAQAQNETMYQASIPQRRDKPRQTCSEAELRKLVLAPNTEELSWAVRAFFSGIMSDCVARMVLTHWLRMTQVVYPVRALHEMFACCPYTPGQACSPPSPS